MQAPDRPIVFVVCCPDDKGRANDLAERLHDAGWKIELIVQGGRPVTPFQWAISAPPAIWLVCASRAVPWTDWEPAIAEFFDSHTKSTGAPPWLLTVLLEKCDVPDALRRFPLVDFSNATQTELDELVAALERAPTGQTPEPADGSLDIRELGAFQLSNEAKTMLDAARHFAGRGANPRLGTASLLLGTAQAGQRREQPVKTPQFLFKRLQQLGPEALREHFPYVTPGMRYLEVHRITPHALAVFRRAQEIAAQRQDELIHARDLLAALLVFQPVDGRPCGAHALLERAGLPLADLKADFCAFCCEAFPAEKVLWITLLLARESAPTGTMVAGYHSEDWGGPDLLDVTPDVNALAALVAGWSVEPPLSIGLFGEWGSGKTFFMRQMKQRVQRLAEAARKSGKPQRELGFYKYIVQIEFNAWHYMEGNLWASLVEHIFANLQFSENEDPSDVEKRRSEILTRLKIEGELKQRAEARRDALKQERGKAAYRAAKLRHRVDAQRAVLEQTKRDFWSRLRPALALDGDKVSLLARLGVSEATIKSAADLRRAVGELETLAGRVRAAGRLLVDQPRLRRIVAWCVGGVLVAAGVGYVADWLKCTPVVSWITQLVALGTAGHRAVKPYVEQVSAAVRLIEEKRDAVKKAEAEQAAEVAKIEARVSALSEQQRAAAQEVLKKKAHIAALERELQSTTANRLLAEFVHDRAACDDYRKHLGMVAVIRRDFEKLATLFREQREAEVNGSESQDERTVNRIVLYIDDLDRCPPERVVQVLQAIHLLLAFPMFVVVVGVDSRWVSEALEDRFEWLREFPPEGQVGPDATPGAHTPATAHDYLEKIFQIPYWLRPMNTDTCRQLVRGLVAPPQRKLPPARAAVAPLTPTPPPGAAAAAAAVQPAPQGSATPSPAPSPAPPATPSPTGPQPAVSPPETIDLKARSLELEAHEVTIMDDLAPLIGRSPRAVKRFVNCYRLIKVTLGEERRAHLVADEQQAREVMTLLAVVTGAPGICAQILGALASADKPGEAMAELDTLPAVSTRPEWSIIKSLLGQRAFDWGWIKASGLIPLVARYSFAHSDQASRVATTEESPRRKAGKPYPAGATRPAGEGKRGRAAR